jgi:hypothetical protein
MTRNITLQLSEEVIGRAEKVARSRQQPLEQVLAAVLAAGLSEAENISEDQQANSAKLAGFDREVPAFEALKPQLQAQYAGRVVAIHDGQVVMTGDDKLSAFDAVIEKYGPVLAYIEWAEAEAPRRARIPSARVSLGYSAS